MAKKRKPDMIQITAQQAQQVEAEARREARLETELRKTITQPHVDKKKESRRKACRGKVDYQGPSSLFLTHSKPAIIFYTY